LKSKKNKVMTALDVLNAVEKSSNDAQGAIKLYRDWLKSSSSDPLAYAVAFNLGTLQKDHGEDANAEKSYRLAIKLNPNCIEAQFNLGAQLQRMGRSNEAVAHWHLLLDSGRLVLPRDQKIYDMTVNTLASLEGKVVRPLVTDVVPNTHAYQAFDMMTATEALNAAASMDVASGIKLYQLWLQGHVGDPLAYAVTFNLGALLRSAGNDLAAEATYRQAIALNPDCIEAQFNLGSQLERLNRPEEAVAQWELLLNSGRLILPRDQSIYLMTLNNLGRLLEIMRNYQAAEDYLTRSLMADATQKDVLHHWYFIRLKQCEWPVFKEILGLTREEVLKSASALAVIASTDDTAFQLECMQRYAKEKIPVPPFKLSDGSRFNHSKIRVAYLSSDFCMHAVSLLTVELFELHNRDEFEVYGFCWSRNDGTAFHQRVICAFDHYIQIGSLTDEAAARLIHSHEIDILVDLHGLTQGARPSILAYRPAPIQVTYLGLPATTGLPSIDYVIADRFLIPEIEVPNYSEKPLYMPDVYQISDRKRVANAKPSRESCGLPDSAFVFCSLNNSYKYTQEMFGVWMSILHRAPNSVLWLLADNPTSEELLRHEAEARGIARDRLIFTQRVLPEDYLARYQVADLFLDTFPFNAGTTANDALWMGLPILTYSGRSFASRMAGALLTAARLEELITFNLHDYEEKAVYLAQHPEECVRMRAHLNEQRLSGVLFDTPRFVSNLEHNFKQLVEKLPIAELPLVSILIPTHNRPDYLEIALKSALAQSYENIEIIISDNGDDNLSQERIAPYLKSHPNITYYRKRGMTAVENFDKCLALCKGEYVNYLMDDDVFHPDKIKRMMRYYISNPNIGFVTSSRQLIDGEGKYLSPIPGTEKLYQSDTLITGQSFGNLMLSNGSNLVGEPTTVLMRRSDIGEALGVFAGRRYTVLSDIATWLSILATRDCIYISEPLSYFRIHSEQDQRGSTMKIKASIEWFGLFMDAHKNQLFLQDRTEFLNLLAGKIGGFASHVAINHKEIRSGNYSVDEICDVILNGFKDLLKA
jgi:predicted O-linked N-acetylglucosamine transferase (SPINDLY family)/glycosyltransferase involved in cell wall biosynthesis